MNREEAIELYRRGEESTVTRLLRQDRVIKKLKPYLKAVGEAMDRLSSGRRDFCLGCFEKQQRIDQLEEEIRQMKVRLRQRDAREGYFGSSTPSSKIPVKANSKEENRREKGGAKPGHVGQGRKKMTVAEADRIIDVYGADICPDCGGGLQGNGCNNRALMDVPPKRVEKILYRLHRGYCPRCCKWFAPHLAGFLPRHYYGNRLLAEGATMHYLHGIPIGRIADIWGIGRGGLIAAFHRLADTFRPAVKKLVEEYRMAAVKHADETGWRDDGHSGYGWLFCSKDLSIFAFRDTRSAKVPGEIFGETELPGTLVVDRYAGYNKVPCKIQYCYRHLLGEVTDLEKEFPDEPEIINFVNGFAPLLAEAIRLHNKPISDKAYYSRASKLKEQILEAVERPSSHGGIKRIQDIFYENAHRLYHWVEDREVPADNNTAERELRPTVIARKVSFGSQSERGAQTREVMMTILHTMRKRTNKDVTTELKEALDRLASNPELDPYRLLFPYRNTS